MAQTTRLASFGPVSVLCPPSLLRISSEDSIHDINTSINILKNEEKKKTHLGPERRQTRHLGLLWSSWPSIYYSVPKIKISKV